MHYRGSIGKIKELIERVKKDRGEALALYQEPCAGERQLFVKLPLEFIKPIPCQSPMSKG